MYAITKYKKTFTKRPNLTACVCLVLLSFISILYITQQDNFYFDSFIIHLKTTDENISCHSVEYGDALPAAEDESFSPPINSIFFHETSCKGGLNSRQACSIESAARAHPDRQINVLFSAPVSKYMLRNSCLAKLQSFRNIKLARVHALKYAKGTPLEAVVANDTVSKSQWRVEHTSDMLRYLSLYKYSGIYLDTDMLVSKSLDPLGKNWSAREDDSLVNAAAIALSDDPIGRKVADVVLREVASSYRPDLWVHNGPGAITRVLKNMCNSSNLSDWSAATCGGFEVYAPKYIYPIHYSQYALYFKPGNLDKNVLESAYTHHLWNRISNRDKVENESPFAKMAKTFCPTIYKTYGDDFGS